MSSSIDISKFIVRLRDLLDGLVYEFRDYDFTFKPLLTQSEFEEKVLPEIKELLTFKNRYIIVYNIFSNLIIESLENENKILCLIDFLVNLSKYDTAFRPLPNDAVKDISSSEIFGSLKKHIFNKERVDYNFDPRLSGINPDISTDHHEAEAEGSSEESSETNQKDYNTYVERRQPRKRTSNASLAAIERAIMNKRNFSNDLIPPKSKGKTRKSKRRKKAVKKKASSTKKVLEKKKKLGTIRKAPSDSSYRRVSTKKLHPKKQNEDNEEESYKNKKMKLVMEDNMDFLFSRLDYSTEFTPELVKEARHGFFYKPPQYSLFAKYDKEADPAIAANLDCLLNKFMEQAYKRVAFGDLDQTPFLHESEYEYIMSNLEPFLNVILPPLIFDQRPAISIDADMQEKGHHISMANLTIQPTKVKNLWKLKIFRSTGQYLKKFKSMTIKDEAKKRFQWINSLITDGKALYSCDKLDAIVRLMRSNPMLNVETDDEDENQEEYEDDETDEDDYVGEDENYAETVQDGENDSDINDAKDAIYTDSKDKAQDDYSGYMDIRDKKKEDQTANDDQKQVNSEVNGVHDSKEQISGSEDNANNFEMPDMFKNSSLFVSSDDDDDDEEDNIAYNKDMHEGNNKNEVQDRTQNGTTSEEKVKSKVAGKRRRFPKGAHALSVRDFQGPTTDHTDNRKAVVTSARGIRLDSMHIRKHLSTQEFMRILAGLVFPGMKISARRPNKVVMTAVSKGLSKVFFNFRPYLIELFLADLDSFFTMPKYFKMDSVMVELQIEEMKNKTSVGEKNKHRMMYYY